MSRFVLHASNGPIQSSKYMLDKILKINSNARLLRGIPSSVGVFKQIEWKINAPPIR